MNDSQNAVQKHDSQQAELSNTMQLVLQKVDIEMLYGYYPEKNEHVYAVRFRNKQNNDTAVYLASDLLILSKHLTPKQQEIVAKLFNFGVPRTALFHIPNYLEHLMSNNKPKQVDNLYPEFHPSHTNKKAAELYRKVKENIQNHIDRYPLLTAGTYRKGDPGLIPNTDHYEEKFSSADVVAVTREHLIQLMEVDHKMRLESILKTWQHMGFLFVSDEPKHTRKRGGSKPPNRRPEKRYQVQISPYAGSWFYVIRIHGLKKMLERIGRHE